MAASDSASKRLSRNVVTVRECPDTTEIECGLVNIARKLCSAMLNASRGTMSPNMGKSRRTIGRTYPKLAEFGPKLNIQRVGCQPPTKLTAEDVSRRGATAYTCGSSSNRSEPISAPNLLSGPDGHSATHPPNMGQHKKHEYVDIHIYIYLGKTPGHVLVRGDFP